MISHTPASLEVELQQCISARAEPTLDVQYMVQQFQHLLGTNHETAALLRLLNAVAVVAAAELEDSL